MKKILSVLVCVCLLLSAMVITASAADTTATISFANKANRTSFSSSKQVWEQNGITVTNEKSSSTSPVGDYADPGRFYKSSKTTIEYPGMTKIEINTSGIDAKYRAWNTSFTDSNATASATASVTTITFATPVDSFVFASMAAQCRANSITVYATVADPEPDPEPTCEHKNTSCEPNGDETHKVVCGDCGETTSEAVDCTDADVNGKCDVCEGDVEIPVQYPAADSTLSIADAAALGAGMAHNTTTTGKYYVEGKIKSIASTTWGNMTIEDAEGNTLYIYGTYSADGQTRYDALEVKPVVGDTVKLYGIIGNYNGAQMKNGWIINHTPATPDEGGEDVTPPAGDEGGEDVTPPADDATLEVVDAVVAGTAYKFGMVQGNVSTTDVYFLAGGMDGYYMATTTDAEAAIDIYVEETDGGYYLYTMVDGAKTYINMVTSGTHVNGAYEATASTVYTYDADSKTMVATVNDELYWFATRNDNTYTTLGPAKVSYAGFYGQFYAEPTVDDGNDDVTPPAGDDNNDDTTGDDNNNNDTTGGTTGDNNNADNSTTSPDTGSNVGAFAVMAIAAAAVVITASKKRA